MEHTEHHWASVHQWSKPRTTAWSTGRWSWLHPLLSGVHPLFQPPGWTKSPWWMTAYGLHLQEFKWIRLLKENCTSPSDTSRISQPQLLQSVLQHLALHLHDTTADPSLVFTPSCFTLSWWLHHQEQQDEDKNNLLDNFLNPHSDLFKPDTLHLFGILESLNHHTLISVQCLSCVVGCFSLLVSHTKQLIKHDGTQCWFFLVRFYNRMKQ